MGTTKSEKDRVARDEHHSLNDYFDLNDSDIVKNTRPLTLSKFQMITSPSLSPMSTTIGEGTVVRKDSDPFCDFTKVLLRVGNDLSPITLCSGTISSYGLSVGDNIGNKLKYTHRYRLTIGQLEGDALAPEIMNLTREERGKLIYEDNGVKRINGDRYEVKSQSGKGVYKILFSSKGWACDCPDYQTRSVKCKHIHAVEFSLKLRNEVKENVVISPVSVSSCTGCHSDDIEKFGIRKNKNTAIQRFRCRSCGKTFSLNLGFEKMKSNPKAITTAMQLYFSGESLRNTKLALGMMGITVSHVTIYNWIGKYVKLMNKYLERITPQVSGIWRTDEMYVKFKGKVNYVFAMMDDDTRYWIAQQVAEHKGTSDVTPMFRDAV
ncbi:MAG: DDE-type integrase/transposase/recombinase, partial [Nitrososphaerota archaeon]|nr:DDE-type integrase/transposase/recombinase [Nitrososphaerota archaeon]